jgi:hypothetical protein
MSKIIKTLTAASTMLGLAACASAPPSTSQSSYIRYVVERDLIVRQSANAGADEVGRLSAGAVLTARVEDVGGNWFRLHSDNGNVGYIFSRPFRIAE